MKRPDYKALGLRIVWTVTEPWFWAVVCVICATITIMTTTEWNRFAAFATGLSLASAFYNILLQRMLHHQRNMHALMEQQQEMLNVMLEMKTDEIAQGMADAMDMTLVKDPNRPSTTKH